MVIRLRCACGHIFDVNETYAGKRLRCESCKKALMVPIPKRLERRGVHAEAAPPEAERDRKNETTGTLLKYKDEGIQWKWFVTGSVLVFGVQAILALGLFVVYVLTREGAINAESLKPYVKYIQYVPYAGFFFAGVLIGWQSTGKTIIEPAVAAALAVLKTGGLLAGAAYLAPHAAAEHAGQWKDIAQTFGINSAIAFPLALVGGWFGELIQGN